MEMNVHSHIAISTYESILTLVLSIPFKQALYGINVYKLDYIKVYDKCNHTVQEYILLVETVHYAQIQPSKFYFKSKHQEIPFLLSRIHHISYSGTSDKLSYY